MESENKKYSAAAIFRLLFIGQTKNTTTCLLYITFIMLGYWGLTTWAPAYLALPVAKGGRGLSLMQSGTIVVMMKMASVLGYATFGIVADKIGLKPTMSIFILGNALSIPFFLTATDPTLLTIATLCTGYFVAVYAGFGPMMAELFSTEIRRDGFRSVIQHCQGHQRIRADAYRRNGREDGNGERTLYRGGILCDQPDLPVPHAAA